MHEEFISLNKQFERIRDIGWIKERSKGLGSCGNTFESLLEKMEDDFPVPDYNDIEIKVMNDNTKLIFTYLILHQMVTIYFRLKEFYMRLVVQKKMTKLKESFIKH